MQKLFAVLALVTLLGVTGAATVYTNGSWSLNPKEVANTNDSQIVAATTDIRLVSSGSNVLLQGVNGDSVYQKTVSTKDLSTSDNKTLNITNDNPTAPNQVIAWDTRVSSQVYQDNNGVKQINVTKYKLTASGNAQSTPQTITSWKNNGTDVVIVPGSATVVPGGKRYYVAAVVRENSTVEVGTLVVVGVDVSGTSTSVTALTTNAPLNGAQVAIAGIAGSKNLWVVWSQNSSALVAAKVDPSKNVTAGDIRDVSATALGQTLRAWSTSVSYGHIVQNGNTLLLQSSTNNWTTVTPQLPVDSSLLTVLPKNDALALLSTNANRDLNLQLVDRNGTTNGTVNLLTGGSDLRVYQHNDGSLYVADWSKPNTVNVGQVWGDTHLAASTLQAAVYACIGLVAALFVF